MTFRKIMLLGAMAMVATAMAAPAAQAEVPQWLHNGTPIEGEEELHLLGELGSTTGGNFVTGPCPVTYEGTASNVNGMASGTITSITIQGQCETSAGGCFASPTVENFPWILTGTTVTEVPGLEISGLKFINHYQGSCPIPVSTVTVAGIATSIVDENGCLSFEEHQDDLLTHVTLPTIPVDTLGSLCETTLTLG